MSTSSIVKTFGSPEVNESLYGCSQVNESVEHDHNCCQGIIGPHILKHLRSHRKIGYIFEESIKDEIATMKYRNHVAATLNFKGATTVLHPLLGKVPHQKNQPLPDAIDVLTLNKVYDGRQKADPPETYPITREAAKQQSIFHNASSAYTTCDFSLKFWHDKGKIYSIDNKGMVVKSFVNTGKLLANAYFDGEAMYYGKGDGKVFGDFTYPFDIGFHEITHGVTQFMFGNLVYQDQSGMLNESFSDVFASIQLQMMLGQKVTEATWKIGLGLLLGKLKDQCLRSMSAPGTAYDNKYMGKDDQPKTYADLLTRKDPNNEDNGNVHLGSSIGNLAFYLVCMELYRKDPDNSQYSWGKALDLWLKTCTGLPSTCTYPQFANIMIQRAKEIDKGEGVTWQAVQKVWTELGVLSVGRP